MMLARLFAELVAPSACASCDAPVRPNILFCASCTAATDWTTNPAGVFAYGGAVADAIIRFKFRQRPDLAVGFARVMLPLARASAVDVVVPVPLHPARLAERGYNQSALLAGPVARALGRPHFPRALARTRDTAQQSALRGAERRPNLAGAFRVRDSRQIAGKNVLLVDDVRTTGSTLDACASALHEVGAARVFPLVLACADELAV